MIRSFDVHDPNFNRRLELIERTAFVEETNSGIAYFVADPERLQARDGLIGKMSIGEDVIDIELIVGEDIDPVARKTMVEICAASANEYDRYSINRAAVEKLDALDEQAQHVAFRHIASNISWQRSVAFARETHPLTRDTIRSSLGWIASSRTLRPSGQEALEELSKLGLGLPKFTSNLRLGGFLRTAQGTVPVGVVYAQEKGERHHCKCCSGQILKDTTRATLTLDKPRDRFDHHHYHPTCFFDVELPQLDLKTARIEPNPNAITVNARK